MIRIVNSASKMYGLETRARKAKSMPTSNAQHAAEFVLDGIKLDQVASFKYLENCHCKNNHHSNHINERTWL